MFCCGTHITRHNFRADHADASDEVSIFDTLLCNYN